MNLVLGYDKDENLYDGNHPYPSRCMMPTFHVPDQRPYVELEDPENIDIERLEDTFCSHLNRKGELDQAYAEDFQWYDE